MLTRRGVSCNIFHMKLDLKTKMLSLAFAAAAILAHAAPSVSLSVPKGWMEDVEKARAKAASQGKFVFMAFSGSDWCGFCIRMDEEVFSQEDFVKEASKKYVLVMIDSPRNKTKLSDLAATQNPALVSKYRITGFPSMVITDSKGEMVKQLSGYSRGGPKAFLEKLDGVMAGVAWPNCGIGAGPLENDALMPLLIERVEDCTGELIVGEDLTVSRKPVKRLEADNCDMLVVRATMNNIVSEINAMISGTGGTAATHLKTVDTLFKQYAKSARLTKEEMLETQLRLLSRLSKGVKSPDARKAVETRLAALKRQTKNAEDYIASEELRIAPEWVSLDGMCAWSVPEKLDIAVSDGMLSEKGVKSAETEVLKAARKMQVAKGAIASAAVKLMACETSGDVKKRMEALDSAIAAFEKQATAALGKFTYSAYEKLVVKSRVLGGHIKLLKAIVSQSDSEAVKSAANARIAELEASAEAIGKKLEKMR